MRKRATTDQSNGLELRFGTAICISEENQNMGSRNLHKSDYTVSVCPVCLKGDFRRIHSKNRLALVKCENCELHIQQPQPSDARLDEIYGPQYFIDFPDERNLED